MEHHEHLQELVTTERKLTEKLARLQASNTLNGAKAIELRMICDECFRRLYRLEGEIAKLERTKQRVADQRFNVEVALELCE